MNSRVKQLIPLGVLFGLLMSLGTVQAQIQIDGKGDVAALDEIVDRIDELKDEKKRLKSINMDQLSDGEVADLKGDLKKVRKELNKERYKLRIIQDANNPWRNDPYWRWGMGPWGWGGYPFMGRFGFYRPFFFGRPFL